MMDMLGWALLIMAVTPLVLGIMVLATILWLEDK